MKAFIQDFIITQKNLIILEEQFINENSKIPLQLTDVIKDGFGEDPYWFCTDELFDDLPGLGYCTYNLYKSESYYEIVVGTRTMYQELWFYLI